MILMSFKNSKDLNYFETYDVIVLAGFQGVNVDGKITSLGRGGSDTTAVAQFKSKKNGLLPDGTFFIAWTTTPWTIPVNRALAYNSKIKYSVIKIGQNTEHFQNKNIVIASELINKVSEECNFKDFEVLKEFSGDDLKNFICSHPTQNTNNKVPVICICIFYRIWFVCLCSFTKINSPTEIRSWR